MNINGPNVGPSGSDTSNILLFKIYSNPRFDIEIYCGYSYRFKSDIMFNSNKLRIIYEPFGIILTLSTNDYTTMINDYNHYFDRWFHFYKFCSTDQVSLDIFIGHILTYYVDLRRERLNSI